MSDKLLEILGIAAVGGIIYLVLENNIPVIIKKTISNLNIIPSPPSPPPSPSHIIPVSYDPRWDPERPPSQKRRACPEGYYEDFTDGILHCKDAHGTRQLAPAISKDQLQMAYGIDYDEEGYGYASPPLIPPSSQTLAPPAPVPQTLPGPITSERKPSHIKKSVNDEIGIQDKKKKKQDKKLAQIPDDHQVHAQIECSDDLKCGSNCYKDGKLYKIVCSEKEKEALYPSKKKTTTKNKQPSIIVPPNFPSQVTITPGDTDEPYPEVQTGGEGPQSEIPPLDLSPGQDQQPISPTIPPGSPGQAPTPSAPAPPLKPIPSTPTPSSCSPVTQQASPTQNKNFTNGCGHGNDAWISCRAGIGTGPNGNLTPESGSQKTPVSTLIGNSQHFHAIYHFKTQDTTDTGHVIGAEITGGYCGSNDSVPQVGITIGVNGKGQIIRRTEDHYKQHNVAGEYNELTPDGATQPGAVGHIPEFTPSSSGKKDGLSRKDFYIIWCADKDGSTVTYRGYIRIGNKEYQVANLVNPREGGGVGFAGHHDSRTKIIDFTEPGHNTYLRGRTNQLGNICPTGSLYACRYQPSANVVKGFSYEGPDLGGYSDENYSYRGSMGYIERNPSYFLRLDI